MSVTAAGAMGAVGMAIGGAGAIMVGGTSALVRGAIEGVKATAAQPQLALPAVSSEPELKQDDAANMKVPDPTDDLADHSPSASGRHGAVDSTGKSRSGEDKALRPGTYSKYKLAELGLHCLACHAGAHSKHLRQGDCKHAPVVLEPAPELPKPPPLQPPPSFESIPSEMIAPEIGEVHGSSAFGRHGIVNQISEVHGSSALERHGVVRQEFAADGQGASDTAETELKLSDVMQAIVEIKDDIRKLAHRSDRWEQDQKHGFERIDILENNLIGFQVQQADNGTELESMKKRLGQLEAECAAYYQQDDDHGQDSLETMLAAQIEQSSAPDDGPEQFEVPSQ